MSLLNYENKRNLKLKIIKAANNNKSKITIARIPGHSNITRKLESRQIGKRNNEQNEINIKHQSYEDVLR